MLLWMLVDVWCWVSAPEPRRKRRKHRKGVGWPLGARLEFARWMVGHVPKARIALRVESSWAARDAVDADLGVALLPCALGDIKHAWRRIKLVPEVSAPLWILTHRDLRATARVRVLRDFLFEAIGGDRALYEGRAPQRGASARMTAISSAKSPA